MKYKITGIILAIVIMMLSLLTPVLENKRTGRVHQHLAAKEKTECMSTKEGMFCTHLPIVKINTNGVEIPGKPLEVALQTVENHTLYKTADDGSTTIAAEMEVIDHEYTMNHQEEEPSLSGNIQIRVRGNSSRYFPKSNYEIRLVKEDGSNNPFDMMGMDAHHEWAMHGPFLDKTLMRNYVAYNLAGEIMDYAPNVRYCELMLNGKYQGVYLMTELITAGEDGARLPLKVRKSNQTFSGYLLRLDMSPIEEEEALNTFTAYTIRTKQDLEIYYPGKENLTPEMKRAIKDDFSAFEKVIYSYDFDSKKYGYKKYIDEQSFVDYFLINELTYNIDAGSKSTYIYKGTDNRYRMCVWDFNNAFNNYQENEFLSEGFFMPDKLWYSMLLKDEDFVEQIVTRYRALRKTYFDEDYLMNYIDSTDAYLGAAIDRNFEVWTDDLNEYYQYSQDVGTHAEEVARMKEWLHLRIAWMDENIESLYQYSAKSAIKKYNENPE